MSESKDQLKFYYDFISQPSRALYIILRISGKPFVSCAVNCLEGEQLTEEYKNEVNRFQKVPAIKIGDFKLAESIAILRFLSHKDYISDELYPRDLKKRARVDEFLSWQHTGVRRSCSLYFRYVWVQAHYFGMPAGAEKVEKFKARMEEDLQLIETVWLRDYKYLTGDALTVADIFGACEVEQIRTTGYDVRVKFPKVANWIDNVRIELRPYFDEAHQIVCKYEQETKARI